MVIVIKKDATRLELFEVQNMVEQIGLDFCINSGTGQKVINILSDATNVDPDVFRGLTAVEKVVRIAAPYKLSARTNHPDDTVVDVNGVKIGGGNFVYIAGPCSVESEESILKIAYEVKASGASILRGGAFKPRTSPYSFQGLKKEGVEYLVKAGRAAKIPVVTEVLGLNHLEYFGDVDMIQIGARNMQNFELIKAVAKTGKPVLLKRGFSATMEEWLMSAEYLLSEGADKVVLCERGIRTFETSTRNTLDLGSVAVAKELTHLPIIVDPSHAAGHNDYVAPLSYAAIGSGADGLMIEVHGDEEPSVSDAAQAVTPQKFAEIVTRGNKILSALKD